MLSLLPAIHLTGVIYRPLGRLTAAMREVFTGNLVTWMDIASQDEVGILAGNFNQMLG